MGRGAGRPAVPASDRKSEEIMCTSSGGSEFAQELPEMLRFEPTHAFIGCPQLARFVDIDFASLLGVGLSKLLADAEGPDACFEDAPLAAQISRTRQPQSGGQRDFCWIKAMSVWIVAEIEPLALPICFQPLCIASEGMD